MQPEDAGRLVLLCVVATLILRWNLWRALLFLKPGTVRVEADAPGDQMKLPLALEKAQAELLALGFTPLGTHTEQPALSRARENYDYVHAKEQVFATLFLSPRKESRLYFLTPTENGGLVITANHHRPGKEVPGKYLSGGMAETSAERVFNAHQRRVQSVGTAKLLPTLEARVEVGKGWYSGAGQPEVRQQNALGLMWTVGSVLMVAVGFVALWR